MHHQVIEWILENQPDLEDTRSAFEESWYLIRMFGPSEFAAIFHNNDNAETPGQFLALILLGIAYYKFSRLEDDHILSFEEAWNSVKDWWEKIQPNKEGGAA